jgi:DNA-binding transcriptional MerR regulator
MSDMLGTDELLSIGRFSRLSGLTVKALRHYDEIGLLRPARVDEATGYRYYSLAQARDAEAIRRLRSLEVPLDEIAGLLQADDARLRQRLAVHRARIEGHAVETQRILAELDELINGEEKLVPDTTRTESKLEVVDVRDRQVLLARERTDTDSISEVIPRLIMETHARLQESGGRFVGAPLCVCPFPDADGTAEIAVGWPVDQQDLPGVETLPGGRALVLEHRGPYEELGRSYRLMSEAMEERGLVPAGAPVERYESNPEEVPDPKDYVTIIEWPIAD